MSKKLAIIDWGIGGISVKKAISETLGPLPTIYFSDTGATPYGKMKRFELSKRLDEVIEYLKQRGATHIIIGCNAASTAIPDLKEHGIPVEGVIKTAVAETTRIRPKRLGLIGGRRTVVSGAYRTAFSEFGIKTHQRIAQPLSGLIESGDLGSEMLKSECRRILSPIKTSSHVLLACTHYVAILPVLRDYVSPQTVFIDPIPSLVKIVESWNLPSETGDLYLTTGDANAMKNAALAAFGWKIDKADRVKVQ